MLNRMMSLRGMALQKLYYSLEYEAGYSTAIDYVYH